MLHFGKTSHIITIMRKSLAATLFLTMAAPAWATCNFSVVVASRDITGKKLSVNPISNQCDSAPANVSIEFFNLYNNGPISRAISTIQVTYASGASSIVVNGSQKTAGNFLGSAYIHGTANVTFNTEGTYTFSVSAGGGPTVGSQTFQVKVSHFTLSPTQLDIATGGVANNQLQIETNLSGSPAIGWTRIDNTGGESNATLSVDQQRRVTATSDRQSGVFGLSASLFGFARSAQITVPPQPLIQVLIGEAQVQSGNGKAAVAGIIRNRLNQKLFGGYSTYNGLIAARNQFSSVDTDRYKNARLRTTADSKSAYDSAVANAAKVFDKRLSASFGNAIGYGSPGATNNASQKQTEISRLQNELNLQSCHRVSATSVFPNSYWYHGLIEFPSIKDQQLLVFNEIDMSDFVFIRPRPVNGCVIVRQSWTTSN